MARRSDPPGMQAAKGSPGKRKRRDRALQAAVKAADAPSAGAPESVGRVLPMPGVKGDALEFWHTLAPELERLNFLRATDRNAFSRYCVDAVRYWDVTKKLETAGYVYTTVSAHGTMERVNPLFVVQERLAKRLESLEAQFGLTPAARQQVMLRIMQATAQLPLFTPTGTDAAAPPATPPPSPIGFLAAPQTKH